MMGVYSGCIERIVLLIFSFKCMARQLHKKFFNFHFRSIFASFSLCSHPLRNIFRHKIQLLQEVPSILITLNFNHQTCFRLISNRF
jgi:hypothetical protein